MNPYVTYIIIFVLLLLAELLYFRIADKCNIIDKPNERSSHSTIVLRGGGIIFLIGVWIWTAFFGFQYPWFLAAVTLAAGISFVDDIRSLPDSVRLTVQFAAMGLMFYQLGLLDGFNLSGSLVVGVVKPALMVLLALIVSVGATNIYNFMDGINGITAGYSLAVLVPVMIANVMLGRETGVEVLDHSFLNVVALSLIVFAFFNFRPKGKAKCFAGDVGSVGMAFILLFCIGSLVMVAGDVTWLVLLLVYGVDGCLTICHRIMLHENLGEAHRKHAYQIMANELGISHVYVSLLYMALQLMVSLGFVLLCPLAASSLDLSLVAVHWIYLAVALVVLCGAYLLFMKKYYHLHEEYLAGLKK